MNTPPAVEPIRFLFCFLFRRGLWLFKCKFRSSGDKSIFVYLDTAHGFCAHISHTGQQQSAVSPVAPAIGFTLYRIGEHWRGGHATRRTNRITRIVSIDRSIPQQINPMCTEMVGYFNLRDADGEQPRSAGAHIPVSGPICMTNRLLISVKIMQNDH